MYHPGLFRNKQSKAAPGFSIRISFATSLRIIFIPQIRLAVYYTSSLIRNSALVLIKSDRGHIGNLPVWESWGQIMYWEAKSLAVFRNMKESQFFLTEFQCPVLFLALALLFSPLCLFWYSAGSMTFLCRHRTENSQQDAQPTGSTGPVFCELSILPRNVLLLNVTLSVLLGTLRTASFLSTA